MVVLLQMPRTPDWVSVEHYAPYDIGKRPLCRHRMQAMLMWGTSKDADHPPKCHLLWGCPMVNRQEWCKQPDTYLFGNLRE